MKGIPWKGRYTAFKMVCVSRWYASIFMVLFPIDMHDSRMMFKALATQSAEINFEISVSWIAAMTAMTAGAALWRARRDVSVRGCGLNLAVLGLMPRGSGKASRIFSGQTAASVNIRLPEPKVGR